MVERFVFERIAETMKIVAATIDAVRADTLPVQTRPANFMLEICHSKPRGRSSKIIFESAVKSLMLMSWKVPMVESEGMELFDLLMFGMQSEQSMNWTEWSLMVDL